MYGIILEKIKIKNFVCVQSVREFTCLIVLHKNLFYLLLEIDISHVFRLLMILLPSEIFIEFGLPLRPRETD